MSTLEQAIIIAATYHSGQKDKGGAPYILHPLAVMARVGSETEKIVAVLHDVLEDTSMTAGELAARGFSAEILSALDVLTKGVHGCLRMSLLRLMRF